MNLRRQPDPLYLRIFLSSPGDVPEERRAALEAIRACRFDPLLADRVTLREIAWEVPGCGMPLPATETPQQAINQGVGKPSECDIVVVILAERMGTPLPPELRKADGTPYLSGTEWEYLDAEAAARTHGRPLLLVYRRTPLPPLDAAQLGYTERAYQRQLVASFFERFRNQDGSLCGGYTEYAGSERLAAASQPTCAKSLA